MITEGKFPLFFAVPIKQWFENVYRLPYYIIRLPTWEYQRDSADSTLGLNEYQSL